MCWSVDLKQRKRATPTPQPVLIDIVIDFYLNLALEDKNQANMMEVCALQNKFNWT